MKLRRSLLLSLVSFTLVVGAACGGGSTAAPTTSASPVAVVPSPSPALTGMDCLVGTWIESPDSFGSPEASGDYFGHLAGMTLTIAADGSYAEDYNNTPPDTWRSGPGESGLVRGTQTGRVVVDNRQIITFTPVTIKVTVTSTDASGTHRDLVAEESMRSDVGRHRLYGYDCSTTALQLIRGDGSVWTSFARA